MRRLVVTSNGSRLRRSALVAVLALVLVPDGTKAAPRSVLGCVTPNATIDRTTHRLRRTWIFVFTKPSSSASTMSYTVASPLPLWALAESNGFYRVETGHSMRGWPFKPETILGWVRTSDVEGQAIRNCT